MELEVPETVLLGAAVVVLCCLCSVIAKNYLCCADLYDRCCGREC